MPFLKLPDNRLPGVKPKGLYEIDWSHPLTRGLTGCWAINRWENLGRVLDAGEAGDTYSGIYNDAYISGKGNLVLDGVDDVLAAGDFAIHAGDITIFTICTPTAVSGVQGLLQADNSGSNRRDFQFRLDNNKVSFIPFVGGSNGSISSTTTLSTGVRHKLGASHSSTLGSNNYSVYVDGEKDNSGTKTGALDSDYPTTLIGAYSTTAAALDGGSYIDEFAGEIELVYVWDRVLSDSDYRLINKDPYQIFKPIIEDVYFVSTGESGGVTGSGSPQAETATSTGSGKRTITGTGVAQAETATSSGTGLRLIVGTGSPTADTATSTGEGTSSGTATGSGSPTADTATASGAGLRIITGSGSPQAETATSTGTGEVGGVIQGSGSPQAETATSSGTGLRAITGQGNPAADTATSSGTGLRLITGSGSPQAETATSTGSGTVGDVIQGSGSPQAETATASGTGLRLITGSGNPTAETATSSGTGTSTSEITGSGSPQADDATCTGVGLRIITGSGAVQAETATASGYDTATTISSCRVYNKATEDRVYNMKTENRVYNKKVC